MMNFIFYWVGGATFILSIGNLKIAVDPVLCEQGTVQDYFWFKSKRIEQPAYQTKQFEDVDLWLITHNHEDHLDSLGLSVISPNSKVITNKNSLKKLQTSKAKDITVLKRKQSISFELKGYQITVLAIPAIHGIAPYSAIAAGKVNGYYLTLSKNGMTKSIYITGDTVYKNRVVKPLKNKKIDLMIPNLGAAGQGTWTMNLTLNAKMLNKMTQKLDPSVVIPVHFGTFQHYNESIDKVKALNDTRIKIINVGDTLKFSL